MGLHVWHSMVSFADGVRMCVCVCVSAVDGLFVGVLHMFAGVGVVYALVDYTFVGMCVRW